MSCSCGGKSVRQLQANLEGLSPGAILELITLINATLSIQTTESSRTCRTHHRHRGANKDEKSQGDPNYVTLNITLCQKCATMSTMYEYLANVTNSGCQSQRLGGQASRRSYPSALTMPCTACNIHILFR